MSNINQYIQAATRENTRKSYQSAVRHFEEHWGGFLPATADAIARYLADYAHSLSINTLRLRVAALGQWHQAYGYPDPTKAPLVRKVLKGIRELHPPKERQAKPLQIEQLTALDDWLNKQIKVSTESGDLPKTLRYTRDRALILLGFWRGFRSDELRHLKIEAIEHLPGVGLRIYLDRTKTTRGYSGAHFDVPALNNLCPVHAYLNWVELIGVDKGPVFRRISRSGVLGENELGVNGVVTILRRCFEEAGLAMPDTYSGHSLRRGFANWANANGWDVYSLMNYVGWRDMKSAMRYLDKPESQHLISASAKSSNIKPPYSLNHTEILVRLDVEPFKANQARAARKLRELVEQFLLSPFDVERLTGQPEQFRIHVEHSTENELEEKLEALLSDIHAAARDRQCFVEAHLVQENGRKSWS